jgi:hypothetical protein
LEAANTRAIDKVFDRFISKATDGPAAFVFAAQDGSHGEQA